MQIKSDLERQQVPAKAQNITDMAMGVNRELTDSEQAQVDEAITAVKTFDDQKRGRGLLDGIGKSVPNPYSNDNDSGVEFLDFDSKSHEQTLVKTLRTKSLVGEGSQVVGTPLVNADPVTLDRPLQSFLAALPVVKRAPVYTVLRQLSRTPSAAFVAPGAEKPVSVTQLVYEEKRLRILATLSEKIGRYVLEDNANLTTFVRAELQYAIQLELEDQALNGDRVGENLTGLVNTSGVVLYNAPAGETGKLVSIRKALSSFDTSGNPVRDVVMNSTDFEQIVTTRNSSGNFDLGGAVDESAAEARASRSACPP